MSQPQSFGTTPGAELTAALIETMTQIRVLNAKMLDIIAEMNREHVAQDAGYASLAAYLTEATHMARTKATRLVAHAALVTETLTPTGHVTPAALPTAREALREGLVDGEHLDAIAKTLDQLPDTTTTQDRELVESTLAGTARTSEPHVVRKHGEILLAHLNADGPEPPDDKPAQPANSFRYQRTRDGGMKYAGRLGHEASEELLSVLGPLAKPQSPLPGMPDPRSEAERHGDALADLIHGALTGGVLPNRGGEKPHLNLLIDYNKLLDGLGIATGDGGSVFCPSAVRRHACDAELIPIVLNGDALPLDVGRKRRLVNLAQRRALVARDQGCAFPGCHLPPRWTDAHHIRHWLDGGPTDLANLVLLCRRHHKLLHDSEWSIEVVDRIPYFRPPRWVDPDQTLLRNVLHHPRL